MKKLEEGEEEAADLMKTSFLHQSGSKHDEGSLVWVLKGNEVFFIKKQHLFVGNQQADQCV